MFLTEQEILDTPLALKRTCQYFADRQAEVTGFFASHHQRKFSFFGCGSSYMLAKGAAALFQSMPNTAACAIPAGDYIVDPAFWQEAVRDSIVVTLSRSGKTTEMVRAVRHIKDTLDCPVISLSMAATNDISAMSQLDVVLDWCYDKSVCQTRTVSNLYAATLLLAARYGSNDGLTAAVDSTCAAAAELQADSRSVLEAIAVLPWSNVVVLADGPVCGIAEEGALAFTEIAMLMGRYFHLLDYRHGPIVVSGKATLTLLVMRPGEEALQGALARDVIGRGGPVVTVSDQAGNPYGATAHIQIDGRVDFAAWGIPLIYLAQMIALLKAIALGGNPDAPQGLDSFITLK